MKSSTYYGKIITGTIIGIVAIIALLPDLIFHLLAELGHLLLELMHLLFEFTEEGLDIVIEHTLGTGLHNTQIIVFYILLAVILYGCYRLLRTVPARLLRVKDNLMTIYTDCKVETIAYWQNLPLMTKLKWLSLGVSSVVVLFLFGF